MKFLMTLFSILLLTPAFAQLTLDERVEEIAKNERRMLWRSGHRDVSSFVTKLTLDELNQLVLDNKESEEPLDRTQISQIYSCFHRSNCLLYLIDVSASMYGGEGHHRLWILMNPMNGKYSLIRNLVYAE